MWINDIETTVFSRVKNEGMAQLKKKYPKINYTSENAIEDVAVFPTVFVQELLGSEVGQDLEGRSTNGVISSFQIDVSDNQSNGKQNCKEIMGKVIESMKRMCYEITATPIYRKENNVWVGTARFKRTIGFNDIL